MRLAQRLHDDDQTLDALQKLALPRGTVPNCEVDSDWKASRLAEKLVDFTCEATRCRLDRIYLEQLREAVDPENGVEESPSMQENSSKSDLDTLYAEIRDVVAMAFSHELEYPLLNSRQKDWQRQIASEDMANQSVSYSDPCSIFHLTIADTPHFLPV